MYEYQLIGLGVLSWTVYCLIHVWRKVFSSHGIPKSIPWPGEKQNFWSRGKSTLQSFLGTESLMKDGYEKYSKRGLPFVYPNLIFGPEVIIPPSQMQWLLNQPEHILSQFETNRQFISGEVTMLHPQLMANRIHKQIIENEMSVKQDTYADDQIDEIQHALRSIWGTDSKQWKEVQVFEMFGDLMTRVISRTFVGLPLCRNPTYLHSAHAFNGKVPLVAVTGGLSVPVLKPLMVRLAHAYDKFHYRKIRNMVLPVIAQRLPAFRSRLLAEKSSTKTKLAEDFGPNDFIQWAMKYAFADGTFDPKNTPEMIAKQLVCMTFASTHATSLSLTNVIYDIANHPDSLSVQAQLRAEIIGVISQQKKNDPDLKQFGRANLAQMTLLDSSIREALRRFPFSVRGVCKEVMADGGIDLPSGEHLPKGMKIAISGWALHHDESNYSNPEQYKPFRFSDQENSAEIERLYMEGKAPLGGGSMTNTGDRYLVFSHGRWSCPGRFFAQNNMKRVLAQIILNYDIEPLQERPKNIWFNNLIGPPMIDKLCVRRRTGDV